MDASEVDAKDLDVRDAPTFPDADASPPDGQPACDAGKPRPLDAIFIIDNSSTWITTFSP